MTEVQTINRSDIVKNIEYYTGESITKDGEIQNMQVDFPVAGFLEVVDKIYTKYEDKQNDSQEDYSKFSRVENFLRTSIENFFGRFYEYILKGEYPEEQEQTPEKLAFLTVNLQQLYHIIQQSYFAEPKQIPFNIPCDYIQGYEEIQPMLIDDVINDEEISFEMKENMMYAFQNMMDYESLEFKYCPFYTKDYLKGKLYSGIDLYPTILCNNEGISIIQALVDEEENLTEYKNVWLCKYEGEPANPERPFIRSYKPYLKVKEIKDVENEIDDVEVNFHKETIQGYFWESREYTAITIPDIILTTKKDYEEWLLEQEDKFKIVYNVINQFLKL